MVEPSYVWIKAEDQKVNEGDEVISSTESNFPKSILTRKYKIAFEWHILLELYVATLLINILLRNTKIDQINILFIGWVLLKVSNHDVLWLQITVNVTFFVQFFKLLGQLNTHINDAHFWKVTITFFENIFEAVTQFLLHNVGLFFEDSRRNHLREPLNSTEVLHNLELVVVDISLRVYLYDHLVTGHLVDCKVYFSKATLAYFVSQLILSFN